MVLNKTMLLKLLGFSFWLASIFCIFLMFTGGFSISILGGLISICIAAYLTKKTAPNLLRKGVIAETKVQVVARHALAFVMAYAVSGYGILHLVHMGVGRLERNAAELAMENHGARVRQPCRYEIKLYFKEGKTSKHCANKDLYAKYLQIKPDLPYIHRIKVTATLKRSVLGANPESLKFL